MSGVIRWPRTRLLTGCLLGALVALEGCGGGGGGSGGDPPPSDTVEFTGFTFRIGTAAPFATPPFENLGSIPSTLGGPLDMTVIFNFTGVPNGPFTQSNLPVYTTSLEVAAGAFPPLGQTFIQAKGSYVLSGHTVEFRPFVPTEPLQIKLSAPPAAVPGLLPGSTYSAQVVAINGQKITNLQGSGGLVKFGTTSNPAAYYASGSGGGQAPSVLATLPPDGSTGFSPAPWSDFALGAALPTFPAGPSSFTLSYDLPLLPTAENLQGRDWDGDGAVEPNFFIRSRATSLLVGTEVPAGSSIGNTQAFPAIAGLTQGSSVAPDGSDIFLHGSQGLGALPDADSGLSSLPGSLASGRDSSLLWVILKIDGGNDRLTVVDQVLGDPSFAQLSPDTALDTGLDDVVGLTSLQSGRLIAYDRTTHAIYELLADVVRHRPTGAPELLSPSADGTVDYGFVSDTWPPGLDVLDFAQAPSGALHALAENGGVFPVIVRLQPIDPDLDSQFEPTDGMWDGQSPVLVLDAAYAAIECTSETDLLALNRSSDSIDVLRLGQGKLSTAVAGVAAYGVPLAALPGGLSPARTLAVGFMDLDVEVTLESNGTAGANVVLKPKGVLPIAATLDVMQRNVLSSLAGVSAANENPSAPLSVLGARRLLSVATSAPSATVAPCGMLDAEGRVNDVFQEEFLDNAFEDSHPPTLAPQAEWGAFVVGSTPSGHLRASVGASSETTLGDFKPVAFPDFNPATAYSTKPGIAATAHFRYVFLDTDVQSFPLPSGATPGVISPVAISGGKFAFRDVIIPEGVWVLVRGSNPLSITATGTVEIRGVLDLSGTDGQADNSFNSGFVPVPGGAGGPGGGRGGDGHPTRFAPNGPGTIEDYVTPETGERGFGPVVGAGGSIAFSQVGGHGGLSTLGADFNLQGYPRIDDIGDNREFTRPPGGGGGTFLFHGMRAHDGTGAYRVQSESSWFPFSLCPSNDKIRDALYGNERRLYSGLLPNTPLQCVYLVGTPQKPNLFFAGGKEGDPVFPDADPGNDFIGPGGELPVVIGGQGGGAGGSRIDSMGHQNGALLWAGDNLGGPVNFAPPYYPALGVGPYYSPTLLDAKGGAGGGGGGSVLIRSFGDIRISRTGHIDASGGAGGGGESIENSNFAGGGGGGSGGAVLLQAAGNIRIEADANHLSPYFADKSGAQGASIDVSGGFGCDARTDPRATIQTTDPTFDFTRSDGGQGGFGLIQLQAGAASGTPVVQQGSFLFARQRAVLKLGLWTGDSGDSGPNNAEHISWSVANPPPAALRYIDMLHYRHVTYADNNVDHWVVLNGSWPPIITPSATVPAGPFQLDTPMIEHFGRRVVKEPEPQKVMKSYAGYDPATFIEKYNGTGLQPGTLYAAEDEIPMSVTVKEPDGTPLHQQQNGVETGEFDRYQTIDRLPVVNPGSTPVPIGNVSRGTSKWLDFNGVALRFRNAQGLAPPLFTGGVNGTYNAKAGVVPPGKDSLVIVEGVALGKPAHLVAKTGSIPFFDPGLCVAGPGPYPPFNDIKVDAPDTPQLGIENAISDNATVGLVFQGAFPIRAGSHVPDAGTLTAWVSDLRELTGYPLVRFQVVFDLAANPESYPFGPDSFRPSVDTVRLRVRY